MKSFSYQFLLVIGTGLLIAFFLHTNPAALPAPLRAIAQGHGVGSWIPVFNQHERGESAKASFQSSQVAANPSQPALKPAPAGTPTLLLNEPMDILNRVDATWTHLPRGTSVMLLADRGPLLQIRHGDSIVTVPRTTVVSGVARTN
jgi:hypothetical protein